MRARRPATHRRAIAGICLAMVAALCTTLSAWHPGTAAATARLIGDRSAAAVVVTRAPAVAIARTPTGAGYWIADSDGRVATFGDATSHGDMSGHALAHPVVGMAVTADGAGYWLVASDGGIFAFGDATFHGSTGNLRLNQPIVGMAPTADGAGYWLVASDGGLFAFGDATFHGSTGAIHLTKPVVGMAPTPAGGGYWLVASDGGIFAFGDATFHGSTGAIHLTKPVVGMAPTPAGGGYWLVASDGGIFAFGDATFHGSTGAIHLTKPVVGMAASPSGGGYWFVASDGGVFSFGDARFYGSDPANPPVGPLTTLPPTTAPTTPATTAPSTTATTTGPPAAPSIDASTPAITVENSLGVTTLTSAPFSPPASSVIYAAISMDSYPTETGQVQGVANSGNALVWHRLGFSNTPRPPNGDYGIGGFVEVWWAANPSAQAPITVTATFAQPTKSMVIGPPVGAMQVIVVDHAAANQASAHIGENHNITDTFSPPTASVITSAPNSLVFGVFDNWNTGDVPTSPAGQTLSINGNLSVVTNPTPPVRDGDAYWTQVQTAPTALSGTTVTMNDTAPSIQFHALAWEVLAG